MISVRQIVLAAVIYACSGFAAEIRAQNPEESAVPDSLPQKMSGSSSYYEDFCDRHRGKNFKRMTYGLEWGMATSFLNYTHNNFFTLDGYRVDIREKSFLFHPAGQLLVHFDYNVCDHFALSLMTGYAGLQKGDRVVPLVIRASYFVSGEPLDNRHFVFTEGGTGFDFRMDHKTAVLGKVGYGFRYYLGAGFNLDLICALQCSFSHPEVWDKYSDVYVNLDNLKRNDSFNAGLNFSFALVF